MHTSSATITYHAVNIWRFDLVRTESNIGPASVGFTLKITRKSGMATGNGCTLYHNDLFHTNKGHHQLTTQGHRWRWTRCADAAGPPEHRTQTRAPTTNKEPLKQIPQPVCVINNQKCRHDLGLLFCSFLGLTNNVSIHGESHVVCWASQHICFDVTPAQVFILNTVTHARPLYILRTAPPKNVEQKHWLDLIIKSMIYFNVFYTLIHDCKLFIFI